MLPLPGTLVYAYCWSGVTTTVNGVNFTGTTSANSGSVNVTLTGFGNNYYGYTGSGSAAFSGAYQNLLAGADWNGSSQRHDHLQPFDRRSRLRRPVLGGRLANLRYNSKRDHHRFSFG